MNSSMEDKLLILEIIQKWVLWRDTGAWERFHTLWHPEAWMGATWFQGSAEEFIELSKAGLERGVSIFHMLGGTAVDVKRHRAIAQTRMTINQRGSLDGVVVDVVCMGRFYDFFEKREDRWGIVRRQGVYDKDWLTVVDPSASLKLDPALLAEFPPGYQHLGYLQTRLGFTVKRDMPQLKGKAVEALYAQGEHWLAGAASAFLPASV